MTATAGTTPANLLANTGNPAIGWITDLRKKKEPCGWCNQSGVLKLTDQSIQCPACQGQKDRCIIEADFADVHPTIAQLVEKKAYRRCSAEIYDEPAYAGLQGNGRTLRRVSFLGGDIPQIKTLKDLPVPDANREMKGVEIFCSGTYRGKPYTEAHIDEIVANFGRFSKGDKVLLKPPGVIGHEEEQHLTKFSAGARGWDGADHAMVITDIRIAGDGCLEVFTERCPPPGQPPKEQPMTREQLLAALAAANVDTSKLKDQPDAALQLFIEALPKTQPAAPVAQPFDVAKFTETVKAGLLADLKPALLAETKTMVDTAVAGIKTDLGAAKGQVDQFAENLRRENVTTFCEQMVKEGRISPAELDKTNPKVLPIDEQLLLADARTPVRKFTEAGKEIGLTQYDLLVNSIKARKPFQFGERIPSPNNPANPDEEIAKVEKFYEDHKVDLQKFSFAKKEDFVDVYKKSTPEQKKQLLEMAA